MTELASYLNAALLASLLLDIVCHHGNPFPAEFRFR